MTHKINDTISDRFELTNILGQGGNSHVYSAIDKINNDNLVAIKIITEEGVQKQYSRIKTEIETQLELANLTNLVLPIIEYNLPEIPLFETPIWILMPIADTADKKLKEYVNLEEIVSAVLGAANALKTCMELKSGFLHRDLKPQNLFFYNDTWCLGDFGLVTFNGKENITKKGDRIGSMYYIAPEIIQNQTFSQKSEVYALAKSLYVLATQSKFPIPGAHSISDKLTSVATYRNEHPKISQIDSLLERATKNDPEERPTLEIFIEELTLWLQMPNGEKMDIKNIDDYLKILSAKNEAAKVETDEKAYMDSHITILKERLTVNLKEIYRNCSTDQNDPYISRADLMIHEYLKNNPIAIAPPFGEKYCLSIELRGGKLSESQKYLHAGYGLIPLPNKELIIISAILFTHGNTTESKWMIADKVYIKSAKEEETLENYKQQLANKFTHLLKEYVEWV